jgi:hypothetical protein
VFGGDNLSFLSPLNFNNQSSSPLDEFQIHQPYPNPAAAAGGSNPSRTFNQREPFFLPLSPHPHNNHRHLEWVAAASNP